MPLDEVALRPYCDVLVPTTPVPLLLVPITPMPELELLPLMHQFVPVTEHETVVTAEMMPVARAGSALSAAAVAERTVRANAAAPKRRVRRSNFKIDPLGACARQAVEDGTARLSVRGVPFASRAKRR